jgi:hypothetical protein
MFTIKGRVNLICGRDKKNMAELISYMADLIISLHLLDSYAN